MIYNIFAICVLNFIISTLAKTYVTSLDSHKDPFAKNSKGTSLTTQFITVNNKHAKSDSNKIGTPLGTIKQSHENRRYLQGIFEETLNNDFKPVLKLLDANFRELSRESRTPPLLEKTQIRDSRNQRGIKGRKLEEPFMLKASDTTLLQNTQPCWEANAGYNGVQLRTQGSIRSPLECQTVCQIETACNYFSYAGVSQKCVLYEKVFSVKDSAGVVSGLPHCENINNGAKKKELSPDREQKTGRLYSPSQLLSLINEEKIVSESNMPEDSNQILVSSLQSPTETGMQDQLTPQNYQQGTVGTSGGGIFDRLLEIVAGGSPGEFLKNIPIIGNAVSSQGIEATLSQGINRAESLAAAGNTVLKTFPIVELFQAGSDLIRATAPAAYEGARGSVPLTAKSKTEARGPPTGVDAPEATCLSEGMRCCVPRKSAPRFQTNPPKLNDINKPQCKATYNSQTDQLCVTTKYEDDVCETAVLETNEVYIYRNIMKLPGKIMNDAICECIISKPSVEPDLMLNQIDTSIPIVSGSGKWQYSLSARDTEDDAAKISRAAERFETGAKLASRVTSTYIGNLQKQGINVENNHALLSPSFMDSLAKIGEGVKNIVENTNV